VWKRDVSRLAFHLAGDVGLRDAANGFTGIGLCPEINSDVADRTKAEIAAKMAKKARKFSLSAAGQVMVCELMPGRHDMDIAVAVDKEAIREPFYINDATYVDIITATSAQTRPMIMKITAGESGDE